MKILIVGEKDVFKEIKKRKVEIDPSCEVMCSVSVATARNLVKEEKPAIVVIDEDISQARKFKEWAEELGAKVIFLDEELKKIFGPGMLKEEVDGLKKAKTAVGQKRDVTSAEKAKPSHDEELEGIHRKAFTRVRETEKKVEKIPTSQYERERVIERKQQVISILGCTGGVGQSSIAMNLAHSLKDQGVLLIDLNFTGGPSDIGFYLGLPETPHLGYFFSNHYRKSTEVFAKTKEALDMCILSLHPRQSHFGVILSPPLPTASVKLLPSVTEEDLSREELVTALEKLEERVTRLSSRARELTLEELKKAVKELEKTLIVDKEDLSQLINYARASFYVIILDLPTGVNSLARAAIDLSTTLVLVTTPYMGSLGKLERELKNGLGKGVKKILVINRYQDYHKKIKEFTPRQIRENLGLKEEACIVIGEDSKMHERLGRNELFRTTPGTIFGDGIAQLVQELEITKIIMDTTKIIKGPK